MTQPDFRALAQELVDAYVWCIKKYIHNIPEKDTLVLRARAELATPPPEENTKPGFINVCVEGPPPAPYENWEDWRVDTFKNRTIKGVCIRALISGDFSLDKKEAATPPPEPTDEELIALKERLWGEYRSIGYQFEEFIDDLSFGHALSDYRAALERWGHG